MYLAVMFEAYLQACTMIERGFDCVLSAVGFIPCTHGLFVVTDEFHGWLGMIERAGLRSVGTGTL